MADIPCEDFYTDDPGTIPKRAKCTRPKCIADRWANMVYSMDLSPEADDDELGNVYGAWSVWDIPCTHASQIETAEGEDYIVAAVVDRLYTLDFNRFADEWFYNVLAPIQAMWKLGPIPSSSDDTETGGYRLDYLKRFREFAFNLRDNPSSATSMYRMHIGEYQNEEATDRAGLREGRRAMRFQAATKGQSFTVTVEHAANEPMRVEHWQAMWDVLGPRIKQSKRGVA
jgi:hypothetical protein